MGPEKNAANLIRALALLQKEHGDSPHVTWVGERDSSRSGQTYCRRVDELLASLPEIQKRWRWLGQQSDIPGLMRKHHALVHSSLYEGFPNVVCEALASGLPVLVSDVCDHPMLVADGERGFLFDPMEPASIAAAIDKFARIDGVIREKLSSNAKEFAEANLGVERMVSAYESLFASLIHPRSGSAVES